jgi:hypothetical protein
LRARRVGGTSGIVPGGGVAMEPAGGVAGWFGPFQFCCEQAPDLADGQRDEAGVSGRRCVGPGWRGCGAAPAGQTSPAPPAQPLSWRQQPPSIHEFPQAHDSGRLRPRLRNPAPSPQLKGRLATAVLGISGAGGTGSALGRCPGGADAVLDADAGALTGVKEARWPALVSVAGARSPATLAKSPG